MKKIIIAVILFALPLAPSISGRQADSGEKLLNVEVSEKSPGAARIIMHTSGRVRFHVFRVSDPPRLVVEMVDTLNQWEERESDISGSIVKRVRAGQYKSEPTKITRVVLDMNIDDYIHDEVSTDKEITILASLTEDKMAKLEKERPDKKIRLSLEPNIPTPEHQQQIEAIRRQRLEREAERKARLEEISRLKNQLEEMRKKDVIPGSIVTELSRENVSFNFRDADIREVLRAFEQKLGRNIIPTDQVTGRVTLRVRDVPFDEAFALLLERRGLVVIQTSANILEVMPRENMPVKRQTFNVRNRDASDMNTTLNNLLTANETENARIAVDEATNSLIVSAPPDILERIELIVNSLDIREPQIKIKARLIEVVADDGIDTGVSWAAHSEFESSEEIERGRAVYPAADYEFDPVTGEIDSRRTIERYTSGLTLDISAVMDDVSLYGLLNFLATKTRAKTLSEPTILTQNKRAANIHVGTDLPIRTVQRTAEGLVENVEFVQEGVRLDVTPSVAPGSDQITLDVNVSVSELIGFRADLPMIGDRAANTLITIQDGKTVVIGGLIRESERSEETGVPLLKDIPLLGYLFKRRTAGKDRSELLIFLTPELVID